MEVSGQLHAPVPCTRGAYFSNVVVWDDNCAVDNPEGGIFSYLPVDSWQSMPLIRRKAFSSILLTFPFAVASS